jgi:hypothetical protein
MPYAPGQDPYSQIAQGLMTGIGLRRQARQDKLGEQQDVWNRGRLERGEQRDIEQTGYERGRDLQTDQGALIKAAHEWRDGALDEMAKGPEHYANYVRDYELNRPQATKLNIELPSMPQYDPRYFEQSEQGRKLTSLKDTSSLYGKTLSMESPQGLQAGREAGLAMPQPQAPPQLPAGPPLAQGQPQEFNMLNQAFPGMAPAPVPSLPAAPPPEQDMWETPGKEMASKRAAQWKAAQGVTLITDPYTQARMTGLGAAAPDFPEIQAGLLGVARMTGAQEAGAEYQSGQLKLGGERVGETVRHNKASEGLAGQSLQVRLAELSSRIQDREFKQTISSARLELQRTQGTRLSPNTAAVLVPRIIGLMSDPLSDIGEGDKATLQAVLEKAQSSLSGVQQQGAATPAPTGGALKTAFSSPLQSGLASKLREFKAQGRMPSKSEFLGQAPKSYSRGELSKIWDYVNSRG